jgi:hypothetical protein
VHYIQYIYVLQSVRVVTPALHRETAVINMRTTSSLHVSAQYAIHGVCYHIIHCHASTQIKLVHVAFVVTITR